MRQLIRLVAAAALVAATSLSFPGTAQAATCSADTGVSVVVDFSKIGGGVATTCVEGGGGGSAGSLLAVSHSLTRDSQYPGVVCRIDGAPDDAECASMPPSNAYWGLFWSDGSGGWTYSSQGVDNLDIPAGGSVAMAWQDGGSQDQPGAAPPQHTASSQPSPQPTHSSGGAHPTSSPTHSATPSTQPSAPPSGSSSASAAAGSSPTRHHHAATHHQSHRGGRQHASTSAPTSVTPSPSDDPSAAVPRSDPSSTTGDDSLPLWVAPVAIGGLLALAGVVALVRRRRAA